MKNPARVGNRKRAAEHQAQYLEETTEEVPTGAVNEEGAPVMISRRVPNRPKFIKWLRGKFGVTVFERMGGKPGLSEAKVGKPYTRVQHRAGGRARG